MATRLYLNDGTNGAIDLGAQAGTLWDQDIDASHAIWPTKELGTVADGNANDAHDTSNLGTGSNPCDVLYGQFISDVLPTGVNISGTVTGTIGCREGSFNDNMFTQLGLYVVDSGGALVATLLAGTSSGGGEWNSASINNRKMPRGGSTAISSYTTGANERIVAEVGLRMESTRTTGRGYMWFGSGSSGVDLLSGDGTDNSSTDHPWIEFSADIFTPPSAAGGKNQVVMFG